MQQLKNIITLFILLLSGVMMASAQSLLGNWKTVDSKTGKVESIINIYEEKGKLYGKVIEILDPKDKDKVCSKCKGMNKNKPIKNLIIIQGLKKDGDEWNGGKILDPKNGKEYSCYLKMLTKNKLKLRGYIGIALAGRTEYWYRDYK